MSTFAVIVLAAGSSSRMGRPKQLLDLNGQTLLQHAVSISLASDPLEVIVVLGSEAESVQKSLSGLKVKTVMNPHFKEGMGSSIAVGVEQLNESIETAVVVLCDQPHITATHLQKLVTNAHPVAASSYDGVVGAPCAFSRSEFPKLLALSGDRGARELIRTSSTVSIPFEAGSIDVDTVEDYKRLLDSLSVSASD